MRTIERNFIKHPHTASFLQVFHTAVGTNGQDHRAADDAAALALEAAQDDDLLDLVPDGPVDLRSPAQAKLMEKLIQEIGELDLELGCQAASWTMKMTESGTWTFGRDPRTGISAWIDRLMDKVRELKKSARTAAPAQPVAAEIPAGRYGVETDEVRCYTVDYGKPGTRWEGFLFLNRISSDDRFPIRNAAEKARILDAIRADLDASSLLAALTLRKCRRCGRELSDTKNPYFDQGYGPECGSKV